MANLERFGVWEYPKKIGKKAASQELRFAFFQIPHECVVLVIFLVYPKKSMPLNRLVASNE